MAEKVVELYGDVRLFPVPGIEGRGGVGMRVLCSDGEFRIAHPVPWSHRVYWVDWVDQKYLKKVAQVSERKIHTARLFGHVVYSGREREPAFVTELDQGE